MTFELGFSYIISEFGWGKLRHQKEFWKISGMLEKKLTNLRILEQFEYSPDILRNMSQAKTLTKPFCPVDQERTRSAHILQQCLEHCPLSTTNQRFFIRIICTTTYRRLFSKRGPRYPKNEFFLEFLGTLESFF